jgi:hypothetical protein
MGKRKRLPKQKAALQKTLRDCVEKQARRHIEDSAQANHMKRLYPNMSGAHRNAFFMAKINDLAKFEAEVIEKSPMYKEIDEYIRK